MYRFVDQPLELQGDGTRFLVWAARQWVVAAVQDRCACATIAAAFAGLGAGQALDDFHIAMRTLCNNARIPLRFGAIESATVSEHEAILVAAAIAALERDEAAVTEIARGLVRQGDMAVLLARSLAGVARRMARAGFTIGASAVRP